MKKNAFTLIELLAVLVILGILSVIIVPTITDSLNNSKTTSYEAQINQIKKGAKEWSADNARELPEEENDAIVVTLGGLIQEGYLEDNVKNPVTQENFPNCMYIEIKRYKNNYVYTVLDKKLPDGCTDKNNPDAPKIYLKGSSSIEINIGDTFDDPGVKATNAIGTDLEVTTEIKKSDTSSKVENIDTTEAGEYTIIYTVSDDAESVSVKRKVIVKDKTPPVITVDGKTKRFSIKIAEGTDFIIPEATAVDTNDGDLTDKITVTGNPNTEVEGTYYIEYSVKDEAGNVKTLTVVVIVE